MTIDEFREYFWNKVREHQAVGNAVRNGVMCEKRGGARGYPSPDLDTKCAIGVLGGPREAEKILPDRSLDELECGFEHWEPAQKDLPASAVESPYYKLGWEVAEVLDKEEAERDLLSD